MPIDYVAEIREKLGRRDPVEVLAELPARLHDALAGLDQKARHQPEAPGKWSIHYVVQHLADAESVNRVRLRLMVAQDRPRIVAWNADRFVERLDYEHTPLEEGLDLLCQTREANLRFLRSLDEARWECLGVHEERGEESVRTLALLMAGHDLSHLEQITRIRRGLGVG